jgi:hypothetical protein
MGQAGLTVIVDAAGIGGRKANRTLHLLSHHVQILAKFPRVGGGNGFENSSHDASWGKGDVAKPRVILRFTLIFLQRFLTVETR